MFTNEFFDRFKCCINEKFHYVDSDDTVTLKCGGKACKTCKNELPTKCSHCYNWHFSLEQTVKDDINQLLS